MFPLSEKRTHVRTGLPKVHRRLWRRTQDRDSSEKRGKSIKRQRRNRKRKQLFWKRRTLLGSTEFANRPSDNDSDTDTARRTRIFSRRNR
jgi:hypothetical protein